MANVSWDTGRACKHRSDVAVGQQHDVSRSCEQHACAGLSIFVVKLGFSPACVQMHIKGRLLTGALCPPDRSLSLESRAQQMCLVQHILPAVLHFPPEANHCCGLPTMLAWKGGVTCPSLYYCLLLFNPLDPDTPIKRSRLLRTF